MCVFAFLNYWMTKWQTYRLLASDLHSKLRVVLAATGYLFGAVVLHFLTGVHGIRMVVPNSPASIPDSLKATSAEAIPAYNYLQDIEWVDYL